MKKIFSKKLLLCLFILTLAACSHTPGSSDRDLFALSPEECLKLGAVYDAKGETALALKYYEKAATADRENADIYFIMGNLSYRMKLYNNAESYYLKAIELSPEKAVFFNNLGWLYMEMNQLDKAEETVKIAVQNDPLGMHVYLDTLGEIQARKGDYPQAEANLKEAASLTPPEEKEGLMQIYAHLLELYRKKGDTDKAAGIEVKIKKLN
ncbi:MAG: tetratricopeptide repeat protein [Deltaproteobacteria bacterium]|nr:tetratricopeptide repeat protein [Deltaproteobacteria bacterium]